MAKIKKVNEDEVLTIKQNHVLKCFTDYLYHQYASEEIQRELEYISNELASGATQNGIIKVSKNSKCNVTPWENELLAREHKLILKQDEHEAAMEEVNQWLADIKDEKHRDIVIEYLINNLKENAVEVGDICDTSPGNVSNVSNRIIKKIARRIF